MNQLFEIRTLEFLLFFQVHWVYTYGMIKLSEIAVRPHSVYQTELALRYSQAESMALSNSVLGLLKGEAVWIGTFEKDEYKIFLKHKPTGDSKAVLAHPELHLWVATVSLSESHLRNMAQALESNQSFNLNELGTLGGICNLHICFEGR
jgi:hypothetical protein